MIKDSAGLPGRLIHQKTNLSDSAPASSIRTSNIVEQAWVRPVIDGGPGLVLCLFNRAEYPRYIWLSWSEIGFPFAPRERKVFGLWRDNVSSRTDGYGAVVEPCCDYGITK